MNDRTAALRALLNKRRLTIALLADAARVSAAFWPSCVGVASVPWGRALKRDEKKIEHWKKKRWPAIKKKPPAKAASSSSLMKEA